MPPPSPRPLTLFTLIPDSDAARAAVHHSANAPFVSQYGDQLVFDVGHMRAKPDGTLVTLGRGNADIVLDSPSLSRIQCSFVINPDTNVVMLHDLSGQWSTQVFGLPLFPFENDRTRQVVVSPTLNPVLGMGGEKRDLYKFQLEWRQDLTNTLKEIKARKEADASISYQEDTRNARTIDAKETEMQTPRFDLRIQVPPRPKIRYIRPDDSALGRGQFGQVFKALDVDTGRFLAVKRLVRQAEGSWEAAAQKREVEVLSRSRHPRIVEFVGQQMDEFGLDIFMALKEGSVQSLVNQILRESTTPENCNARIVTVGEGVFPQMLSALDFLAYNGVVHRDVKPANILYDTTSKGKHNFYLGDFGLCHKTTIAETLGIGTKIYMAPELNRLGPQEISGTGSQAKADVWSLFATMLWILDVNGYRERSSAFWTHQEAVGAVVYEADNSAGMASIREMAIYRPELRASAAQMLLKIKHADDLTTPRNYIPALIQYHDAVSAHQAPVPAPDPSRFPLLAPAPRRPETPTIGFLTARSTQTPSPWQPLTPQSNSPAIPERRSARLANKK
ncbi:Serine/threonine-protein kinase RAD53 [Ilyonectria robusta]